MRSIQQVRDGSRRILNNQLIITEVQEGWGKGVGAGAGAGAGEGGGVV